MNRRVRIMCCSAARLTLDNALLLGGIVAVALALSSCAEVQTYGAAAAQYRKQMNDLQLSGTVLEACDVALGSYYRASGNVRRALDELCNPDPAVRALTDDRRPI